MAIALGVLGTSYCDLGELGKARELLESSVEINSAISGEWQGSGPLCCLWAGLSGWG